MEVHRVLGSGLLASAGEVHRALGSGLLASAGEECLCYKLRQKDLRVQRQVPLPIFHKGVKLDCGYRMDTLVEKSVVVELKTVEKLLPIHQAQLLACLKPGGFRAGLLLNLACSVLRGGIKRAVFEHLMNTLSSLCLCVSMVLSALS
jgi:GxxExxY protein